ncbi:MAG: chemotaxis protein CheY [Gammaproteobacteria bacterium (ex Lamellibrachia satsuma)]|nr:MAG: response regulator transcription factor [Gammaproteobacteria bacterium (ex Lamellibrachia satsuma)]RRS33753.1 MAG: chemotaxis protein CheY [Gammaproteobacteria bacterium (ex Lamellibrachia satsuma)]RRS37547.1 MAG: chemotaxis protein CheY [Gammaproteobacteria bacterium (ex Lamellibrachia satsuma)]
MRILLVDDEALARERLAGLIAELGAPYRVVGEAVNGEDSLKFCAQQGVDLVLMDIRMPGMDGLEAAGRLAGFETPPAVIFTTAYEEHALEAFEREAQDYLLKPVRRERLRQALERSCRITRPQRETLGQVEREKIPQLSVTYRGGVLSLSLDEVIYLRADSKYIAVRHGAGEALLEDTLKSLEDRYADWLLRIHRNALVVRRRLKGLERGTDGKMQVVLIGCEERLEVSRRHLPEVRRWLKRVPDG